MLLKSAAILSCPQSATGCVGYEDRSPNWSSPSLTIKPSPDHGPSFASKYSQCSDCNKLDKWKVLQGMLVPNTWMDRAARSREDVSGVVGFSHVFSFSHAHMTLCSYVGEGEAAHCTCQHAWRFRIIRTCSELGCPYKAAVSNDLAKSLNPKPDDCPQTPCK